MEERPKNENIVHFIKSLASLLTFSSAENLRAQLSVYAHVWPLKKGLSPTNLPEKVITWQNLSSLHDPEKIWSNNLIKVLFVCLQFVIV